MVDFRKLKFNPVWIAIGTIWIPHLMTRLNMPETPKVLLITGVVFVQIYFVYLGIERLNEEKKAASTKKKK